MSIKFTDWLFSTAIVLGILVLNGYLDHRDLIDAEVVQTNQIGVPK